MNPATCLLQAALPFCLLPALLGEEKEKRLKRGRGERGEERGINVTARV